MKKRNIELDILRIVKRLGPIDLNGHSYKENFKQLRDLYDEESDQELMRYMFKSLVKSRHLSPIINDDGREVASTAFKLTAKGERRLQKLECPIRAWARRNWFPLSVAIITAGTSIANIVLG